MAKGRPRTDSIPRFNVDTYLSSNRKFIMFKRKLSLDEAKAYLTLVRFFNYVNANCAITANLKEVHAEALAEFCFWEKEPSDLWKVLCEVGFIDQNGDIHDQETHQPLASEIKRKRKINEDSSKQDEQKQDKANLGGNNRTEVGTNPQPITYNLEPETCNEDALKISKALEGYAEEPPTASEVKRPSTQKRSHQPFVGFPKPNGQFQPSPELKQLANDLLKAGSIYDQQDRKDVAWDVYHAVQAGCEDEVHKLIAEFRQDEHTNAEKPAAIARARLKQAYSARAAPVS